MIIYIYRQEYSDGLLHDNQLFSQYTEDAAISADYKYIPWYDLEE